VLGARPVPVDAGEPLEDPLGLAIARGTAVRHGGTLELAAGPGPGATFVLRLPLAQASEAGAQQ